MSAYKSSPCFKCDNRNIGCHSCCTKYAKFKGDLSVVSNNKNENVVIRDYVFSNKK